MLAAQASDPESAILASDLAGVIGSAVARNLLFRLPLALGNIVTAADVLIILFQRNKAFRYVEALVGEDLRHLRLG